MKQLRKNTTFQIKYVVMVWQIITVVFATWLQSSADIFRYFQGTEFMFGLFVPFVIGGFVLLNHFNNAQEINHIADKSFYNHYLSLVSYNFESHGYYYPALSIQVTPIFSIFAVMNKVVAAILLPFILASLLLTFDIRSVSVAAFTSIALCWLVFAAINIVSIIRLKRHQAKSRPNMRTVNMDFCITEIQSICFNQEKPHYIGDWGDRKEMMDALGERAIWAGFLANDLITNGHIDSDTFESEINTIEHVLNTFIPNTISTTKEFFKTNKNNKEAAERIYEKDLEPKIIKEATSLDTKVWRITKALKNIEELVVAEQKKKQDSLINVEDTLLILSENANIPLAVFPEFNELAFNSEQKRVAAKNIVTSALKTLVDTKNKAVSQIDIDKLDGQINKVKAFVRSLASDTPESAQREARLIEATKADPLFLGTNIVDINDVDNTIAIIDRYIDGYDKSLPISKK